MKKLAMAFLILLFLVGCAPSDGDVKTSQEIKKMINDSKKPNQSREDHEQNDPSTNQQEEQKENPDKDKDSENQDQQGLMTPPEPYQANGSKDDPNLTFYEGAVDGNTVKDFYTLKEVNEKSLINKYNRLPVGWQPENLKTIKSNSSRDIQLMDVAADAYNAMEKKASDQGITLVAFSGFRSADKQVELYGRYEKDDKVDAVIYSAYPRASEHEAGLAVDIGYDESFPEDFLNTPQGKFLDEHAHEFGFILRYPENTTDITGYHHESWHFRYVGKDLAKAIKASGKTLEEFYGVVQ